MSRALLFLSAVLVLDGCSGGISKPHQPVATQIEDATQSRFHASDISVEVLEDKPEASLIMFDRPECNKGGAAHNLVSQKLTPGTKISKVSLSAKGGEPIVTSTGEISISSNSGAILVKNDNFEKNGHTYKRIETCSPLGSGDLTCTLNDVEGKPLASANNCTLVEDSGSKAKIHTEIGGSYTNESGLSVSSWKDVIVEKQGNIVCLGKWVGRGSITEKTIYSADAPSLTQDSCYFGEIYKYVQLRNADGSIRENRSSETIAISYGSDQH